MKLGIIFIAILTYFLFSSGSTNYDSVLYRSLWEGGHFVLFAAIIFVLLKLEFVKNQPWYILVLAIAPFCIIIGFATEFLQLLVGRSFQYSDVVNDVIGGYAGFLFSRWALTFSSEVPPRETKKKILIKRLGFVVGFLLLSLIGFREFLFTSVHVWSINTNFPILANFEAPLEVDRWEYNRADISISNQIVRRDKRSLQATFYSAKYPSIELKRMATNWDGYDYLNLSINNPSNDAININLRIYDIDHMFRHYQYSDRFNKKLILFPGWNDLQLSIKEIKNSPQDRKMNMKKIHLISLFMIKVEEETTVYIDDIFLSS